MAWWLSARCYLFTYRLNACTKYSVSVWLGKLGQLGCTSFDADRQSFTIFGNWAATHALTLGAAAVIVTIHVATKSRAVLF